ncbi:GMC oxidoreductase [Rhizoctonia solani]|uniref:GMC oxidoreductase n=1 Tax=Rhizoctonia solani TaxID=456999 RepID=A0A8H7HE70_9AGAM|nr:GMC oxidoreductase [Rhizoctonia solani]
MALHPTEVDIIFVGASVAAGRLASANPALEILLVEQGPNNYQDRSVLTPSLFPTQIIPGSGHAIFWKGEESEAVNGREQTVVTGGILGGGSSPFYPTVAKEYLDACITGGIPQIDDLMDLRTGHACGRLAQYIDPLTGYRQDAAHQYIHTQSNNKGLHVLTETLVTRVLFEGTKAVGIEVVRNQGQDPDTNQSDRRIFARKLVVMSAGALGSSTILQRSGIGEASQLSDLSIQIVGDLPGVGKNYEDHPLCLWAYHVSENVETYDPLMEQQPEVMERYQAEFERGKGIFTSNSAGSGSKLRPTSNELKAMGSDFNERWKNYYEVAPDKAVVIQVCVNGFVGPRSPAPEKSRFMMIGNIATYPLSKGQIHITGTDPYLPPKFRTGLLEEQADVEIQKWAYKKARECARRMRSYRGEYAPLHPKFPKDSAAACIRLDGPPPLVEEDLIYTPEDDAAIEVFIRQMSQSTYHSCGTLPMKPEAQGGCVDPRLNVHGTTNLKVADLSILPSNVGSPTYSIALMIGEKAAVLIAEDLGLKLP